MNKNAQLLKKFVSNCKNTCYITSDFSTMNEIPSVLGESYCVIDLKHDNSPLKPFLELLRFYNPSFKTLEAEIYPVQLETFATYIHNGVAIEREDFILDDEIPYEKKRIKNSLISLIEKQNDATNYIFLNAQYMSADTLEIALELEKSSLTNKFIFCFDSENPLTARKTAMDFIKKIERNPNTLCEFALEKKSGNDLEEPEPVVSPTELINSLKNSRLFLDLKTASSLAASGVEFLKNRLLTKALERELNYEIALAYYICGDFDKAAVLLTDICDSDLDDDFDIRSKLILSKIYISKSMIPLAKKYALIVLQKLTLQKRQKSPLFAIACMLDYLSIGRDEKSFVYEKYNEATQALLKNGLNNNYLNTALHFPPNIYEDKAYLGVFENILEKTERIAQEIQNQHLIAAVFHWKALFDEIKDDTNQARKDFEKAEKIRTELGDLEQLIRIKNGISDFYLRIAHIKEAYNILNDCVQTLFQISDYTLIIEMLKNMAQAAFYFHDYASAEKITLTMVDLYKKFVTDDVAINSYIPKIRDVYCYQAITDIYNGDFFHAEMTYSLLSGESENLSDNCKPFVPFIYACIIAKSGETEKARKVFGSAIAAFKNLRKYNHSIVFLYYEFAILLNNLEQTEPAKECFAEGFEFARKNSLVHFYKNKKSYSLEYYQKSFAKLAPLNINLSMLEEKGTKDYTINHLHQKINEYQFINKVNSYSGILSGQKAYLEKIAYIICEFLTVQSVSFAGLGISKKWNNITSFAQSSTLEKLLPENVWENLFNLYGKHERLELIFDSDYELYYCNLSKFDFHGALIIIPHNNKTLNSSVLQVLNIALANIQSQLVIYQQNENLSLINATDPITALPNRRALLRHLTLESERIERFNKRKGHIIQKAIAIIDIENFKYYNEQFGHIAGDFILRSFAEMLKNTLRRIDFVCRYGGDEFVVVMGDTSAEEGERMCQRLYIELSKTDFFLTELKKFVNRDFDVPENKKIGFSMGLCTNTDVAVPENLTEVLRNADKALQFTKKKGKGSVACWSNGINF